MMATEFPQQTHKGPSVLHSPVTTSINFSYDTLVISAPAWNSETGLEFTGPNQHIQLPGFLPSNSDLTVTTSLGFSLYLTIDTVPTSEPYIFYYWCSQVTTNLLWS